MKTENLKLLSRQEEEFASLLTTIGIKRNIARVLVFFGDTQKATSHEIERVTGLRQPEVSLALQYLASRHWIKNHTGSSKENGRPNKIYELSTPLTEIMDCIQDEKRREVENDLALLQKLRDLTR